MESNAVAWQNSKSGSSLKCFGIFNVPMRWNQASFIPLSTLQAILNENEKTSENAIIGIDIKSNKWISSCKKTNPDIPRPQTSVPWVSNKEHPYGDDSYQK